MIALLAPVPRLMLPVVNVIPTAANVPYRVVGPLTVRAVPTVRVPETRGLPNSWIGKAELPPMLMTELVIERGVTPGARTIRAPIPQ